MTAAHRLLAVACVGAAAWCGAELSRGTGSIAAIWPANAVLLIVLLRSPQRAWPVCFGAGVAAIFLACLTAGDGWRLAAPLTACNAIEVVVAATLVRRKLGRRPQVARSRSLLLFCLWAGAVAPAVSATLAASYLWLTDGAGLAATWQIWFGANALGMMIVAPLLLVLNSRDLSALFRRPNLLRSAALLAAVVAVVALTFVQSRYPTPFLILPALLLAAVRLGFAGASLAMFSTAAIALGFTVSGHGPLAAAELTIGERVMLLQVFLAVAVLTILPLATVLLERRRLERKQQAQFAQLMEGHRLLEAQSMQLGTLTEKLLASDAVFRGIFDNSTDCIFVVRVSPEGVYRLETLNHAAEATFAISMVRTAGLTLDEILPRRRAARIKCRLDRCVALRAPLRMHDRYGAGHNERHWEIVLVPLFAGQNGRVVRIVATARDVTQRVRHEAMLSAAKEAAESAARAKSDFLAAMSHELRTPMTGVLGMIDLLRTDPPAAERWRFLDALHSSAKTLMGVLGDVLDFSKIEAGQMTLESVDFRLRDSLRCVIDLFASSAEAKGLSLRLLCEEAAADAVVRGDPTRLQQILANLVGNAVKFTSDGGIELAVEAPAPDDADQRWRFSVRDTGIGIDADSLARLFQPFSQADASTTRRFGGTGLGLAICRRLAHAMGGEISVQSTPGVGSQFTLTVPLPAGTAANLPKAAGEEMQSRSPARPLRVLVAEDNAVNQLLLTSMLQRMGHTATCVENGRLAVEAASEGQFDVVLMDMQMPEMDGPTATRLIRGLDGAMSRVPIIGLTADTVPEHQREYEEAGLSGFLTKPIQSDRLFAALEKAAGTVRAAVPEQTAPAAGESLPDLDLHRLSEFEQLLGAHGTSELLEVFRKDAAAAVARLADAVARGDAQAARRIGHALKGAAVNIGAPRLASLARSLEHAEGDDAELQRLLADIEPVAAAAQRASESWLLAASGQRR